MTHLIQRIERRHLLAIIGAAVLLAVTPFILPSYPLSLFTLALVYGLFAFSLDLAWGRAGVISIGHAAFFGIGAYGVAIGVNQGIPLMISVPLSLLLAAGVALIIGFAGLRRGASPSTMAVLTLALTLLAEQTFRSLRGITNGANGLYVPNDGILASYFQTAGIVFVVVVAIWFTVIRGRLGRRMVAVRVNESRTEHLGVDPKRVKITAFVLSATIAALAGAISAPLVGMVSPSIGGIILSTQVLVFVAVGGLGSIFGVFLGASLVTIGQFYLNDAIGSWDLMVVGLAFVLVVRFAPGGIMGIVGRWLRRPTHQKAAQGAVFDGRASTKDAKNDSPRASRGDTAIRVKEMTKSFGETPVIRGVDAEIEAGEIVCLIGPNGAGKTTLLNLIAGELIPTSGRIEIYGADVTSWQPHQRAGLGLGRLFQNPSVYPELTPAQNLKMAQAEAHKVVTLPDSLSRFTELDDVIVRDLSLADLRALELAMAIAWGPEIVLLDEPAAGLSHEESVRLATTLREINQEMGCTLIVVEHDMDIVKQLGDRVVVLADGRVLVSGTMDEVIDHEDVRKAYIGAV